MCFDFFTKLFHFDSSDEPQLDTAKLAEIKKSWQVDIVESSTDDPLVSAKEKGVNIISEELTKHGRVNGGAWRSTTKGRGNQ